MTLGQAGRVVRSCRGRRVLSHPSASNRRSTEHRSPGWIDRGADPARRKPCWNTPSSRRSSANYRLAAASCSGAPRARARSARRRRYADFSRTCGIPDFSPGAPPISRDASQGPGSYRDLTTDLHNCVEWQPEIIGQMGEISLHRCKQRLRRSPQRPGVIPRRHHLVPDIGASSNRSVPHSGIIRRPLLRPTCSMKKSAECFRADSAQIDA